ncbi:putative chorismate mutase [Planoprotostelium fungivorum]|uniref:chorismate mutase n=1 Tax=Planoprotostelium fungivorum TaxID=1890364 RepID=A0A2P6N0Y2_9EUKA|nr:putative chorismate mutase [Planoprotostelium fungivorum]
MTARVGSSSVSEDALNLSFLREQLIRQEETIIFNLIERAQWKQNKIVYEAGGVHFTDTPLPSSKSFLDYLFEETEKLHSLVRRYESPDENPFYPAALPKPLLPLFAFTGPMHPNTININDRIKDIYLKLMVPRFFEEGDDGQYGSAVTTDIAVLQALSKRIHFGKYVAEVKFREDPQGYTKLAEEGNIDGIMKKLTNAEVEAKLLRRVHMKASTYGQEIGVQDSDKKYKLEPGRIEELYREYVVPLTKEVLYLIERSKGPQVSYLGPPGTFSEQSALKYFGRGQNMNQVRYLPCGDIEEVFSNVLSNKTVYGMVPVENSKTGLVHRHMDLLTKSEGVKICGEIYLPISFAFMVKDPSITLSQVQTIYSHSQGLEQCKEWLDSHANGKALIPVNSTARGAQMVAEDTTGTAACVANTIAGSNYNLHVLQNHIETSSTNVTRFLVISRHVKNLVPSGNDKTSVLLDTTDKPGALASALNIFAKYELNLSIIQSYPDKESKFNYRFYVEVQGHSDSPHFDKAIEELRQATVYLEILGSYSCGEKPANVTPQTRRK